jgi:hypothetical protein
MTELGGRADVLVDAAAGGPRRASGRAIWPYLVLALTALFLILFYISVFSTTARNADVVNGYLTGLDMGGGNWRLADWYIAMNNYWFQDTFAYALATRLFGDDPFIMVILPAVTWAGVVVAAWGISRRDPEPGTLLWSVLVIGAVLAFPVFRDNPLMVFITVGSDHVLTLLQALLLFLIADLFLRHGGYLTLGLFLALATASDLGDPLVIFIVALPVGGAALITGQAALPRRLTLAGAALFSIVAGYAIAAINQATGGFVIVDTGGTGFSFASLGDVGGHLFFTFEALLGFWSANFFGLPLGRSAPQLLHLPVLLLAGWATAATSTKMGKSMLQLRAATVSFLDCALALGIACVIARCVLSTVMYDFWSGRYVLRGCLRRHSDRQASAGIALPHDRRRGGSFGVSARRRRLPDHVPPPSPRRREYSRTGALARRSRIGVWLWAILGGRTDNRNFAREAAGSRARRRQRAPRAILVRQPP